ncbi:MAG: helix-turn-helix domain-containing protein, partial [Planctomycetaceae bacterium]
WPGNVRELVNMVERAVVLSKSEVVSIEDLPEAMRRDQSSPSSFQITGSVGGLKTALVAPERQIILNALESHGWNRQKTAAALGINRTTLYKKMKKYEISFEHQILQNS